MEMATHTKLFALTLIICLLLVDLSAPSSSFHGSEAAENPVNQAEVWGRNLEMEMDYEKDPGANNKHLPPSNTASVPPPGVGV